MHPFFAARVQDLDGCGPTARTAVQQLCGIDPWHAGTDLQVCSPLLDWLANNGLARHMAMIARVFSNASARTASSSANEQRRVLPEVQHHLHRLAHEPKAAQGARYEAGIDSRCR